MLASLGGTGFLIRSGFLRKNVSLCVPARAHTQGSMIFPHNRKRKRSHLDGYFIYEEPWGIVERGAVKFLIAVVFLLAFSYLAMGSDGGGTGFLKLAAPKSGTGFLNISFS